MSSMLVMMINEPLIVAVPIQLPIESKIVVK